MKTKTTNSSRLDILGNGDSSTATRKKGWQRLGYCSILAAVPTILASHVSEARSDESKKPETSVAGRTVRLLGSLNNSYSSPALLKRQSEFRLPHQNSSVNMLAPIAGNDECPGRTIPGGSYTAGAPFSGSGNTTGANDTVTRIGTYYYYYSYDALGPDHVYSFTITSLGSNPQIEVSTTSGEYRPLIYVLQGGNAGACPTGTGNSVSNQLAMSDSRWTSGSTATLNSGQMNNLPLNVPLHLFVDSARNDASGSGAYTIRMQDVTIAVAPGGACANPNPIDCPDFFVRQQYLDLLGREPDTIGFQNWVSTISNCGNSGFGEFENPNCDRVHSAAGFFLSEEFRVRGYWAYRFYKVSLGRAPLYAEFIPDMLRVGGPQSPQQEEVSKQTFADDWVNRAEFKARYDAFTNPADYVDELLRVSGIALPGRDQLVDGLITGRLTRAQVLRQIVESNEVEDRFFIEGFVSMQYFGFLRRDPDTSGYGNWVATLRSSPGDYRHMIFGFIYSTEYRNRFAAP